MPSPDRNASGEASTGRGFCLFMVIGGFLSVPALLGLINLVVNSI